MGRFLIKLKKTKHLSQIRELTPTQSSAVSATRFHLGMDINISCRYQMREESYMQAHVSYMWILKRLKSLPVLPWPWQQGLEVGFTLSGLMESRRVQRRGGPSSQAKLGPKSPPEGVWSSFFPQWGEGVRRMYR